MADWNLLSPWIPVAGAATTLALGCRWAFQSKRVVANPRSGASDPQTVRRFGYVMIAIGGSFLVVGLLGLFAGLRL